MSQKPTSKPDLRYPLPFSDKLLGERFPAISAQYEGRIVSDVSELVADKGMVFIANRSVDW